MSETDKLIAEILKSIQDVANYMDGVEAWDRGAMDGIGKRGCPTPKKVVRALIKKIETHEKRKTR